MRRGAATRGGDPHDLGRVQSRGVSGRQVAGHEDPCLVQDGGGPPQQAVQHSAAHAREVRSPKTHIGIVEPLPGLAEAGGDLGPRLSGGEPPIADRRPGRFQQLRILEEEQVRIDDLRLIAPRPRPGLVT